MSFLTGQTKQISSGQPGDIAGLRKGIIDFLTTQGFGTALTGGGVTDQEQSLFQKSLAPVLAQAKESAGNLTGSGLGNIIGTAAGRSTSDFLLNLLKQKASNYSSLLGGLTTAGVGPPTYGHQPGFLDYLFQGAKAAAPFLVPAAAAGAAAGAAGGGGGAVSLGG